MKKRSWRAEKREPTEEEILAEAREPPFEQISEEARLAYFGVGNKPRCRWALMDIIRHCAARDEQLPIWATQVLDYAFLLGIRGELRSWDEIFGKPHQEFKNLRDLRKHLRQLRVYMAMRGRKVDPGSFEALAAELGIGSGSTVRDLYYAEKRRRKDPAERPRSRRKRPPEAR